MNNTIMKKILNYEQYDRNISNICFGEEYLVSLIEESRINERQTRE